MLKGRTVTLKLERPSVEGEAKEHQSDEPFEDRAEVILKIVERIGTKMFAGLVVYVLLDTHRKVAVAKAKRRI